MSRAYWEHTRRVPTLRAETDKVVIFIRHCMQTDQPHAS